MNPELNVFENDPFGYLEDLRDGWADPDLLGGGPEAGVAAYRLALAQGRCSLFGIRPEEEMARPLPPELALAAADELARRLEDWGPEAASLGTRWDTAIDPAEGDELCARLLKFRMDVWAIQTTLSRAYLATPKSDLGCAIDRLATAADQFDRLLETQADMLSTLTGTCLLDNWRAALAPEYRDELPWWLDGSLEEVARRIGEQADRDLPDPQVWARARRQVNGEGDRPVKPLSGGARAWAWVAPPPAIAASGTMPPLEPQHRRWRSGEVMATLAAVPGQEPTIRVNFSRHNRTVQDLAGQTAFLGGVPAVIDSNGDADFDVEQLRQARDAGRPESLAVGDPAAEWEPIPEEGNES